jgi:hypothetical protein
MGLEPHRILFLVETGTTTKMKGPRVRSLKAKRLHPKAPFGHWKMQTFIAGLRCDALTPFVIDAPMDRSGPLKDCCVGPLMPGERNSVPPTAALYAPARVSAQHRR